MKYFDELNQRFGEAIRNNVVKDIARGRTVGPSKMRRLARFLAFLIIVTPYCVAAAGIAMIVFNLDNIPAIIMGTLISGAGFYLRTPRHRNTDETLRRADAPQLFSLLDDISKKLNAPMIDGIHVNRDFNAYVTEFGEHERILGIGAPLWFALEPPERLAVLSHEVAHLINRDPARGRLTFGALDTLARWHDLTRPPALVDHARNRSFYYEDRGFLGQVVGALFGGVISTMAFGFEKLIFADNQRAEYLADIASAEVSGRAAGNALLNKIILAPLAQDVLKHTRYDGSKNKNVFQEMAGAVRAPDQDRAAKLVSEAMESLHTVDATHPPTRFRIEVVAAAGSPTPAIDADLVHWAGIDDELAPHFAREEQRLLSDIIVQ